MITLTLIGLVILSLSVSTIAVLEFDHFKNKEEPVSEPEKACRIWAKRETDTDWICVD